MPRPVEEMVQALRDVNILPVYLIEGAPDTKDTVASLTPYLGTPIAGDQEIMGDRQNVQAYARGANYADVHDLAWDVYKMLMVFMRTQTEFDGYALVDFFQSPTYIGKDEKQRYLMSFNMQLRKLGFED